MDLEQASTRDSSNSSASGQQGRQPTAARASPILVGNVALNTLHMVLQAPLQGLLVVNLSLGPHHNLGHGKDRRSSCPATNSDCIVSDTTRAAMQPSSGFTSGCCGPWRDQVFGKLLRCWSAAMLLWKREASFSPRSHCHNPQDRGTAPVARLWRPMAESVWKATRSPPDSDREADRIEVHA